MPAKYEKNIKKKKKIEKVLPGPKFCTQSQWDLWAIFFTTQKSCGNFSRLCQKLVTIV